MKKFSTIYISTPPKAGKKFWGVGGRETKFSVRERQFGGVEGFGNWKSLRG